VTTLQASGIFGTLTADSAEKFGSIPAKAESIELTFLSLAVTI